MIELYWKFINLFSLPWLLICFYLQFGTGNGKVKCTVQPNSFQLQISDLKSVHSCGYVQKYVIFFYFAIRWGSRTIVYHQFDWMVVYVYFSPFIRSLNKFCSEQFIRIAHPVLDIHWRTKNTVYCFDTHSAIFYNRMLKSTYKIT